MIKSWKKTGQVVLLFAGSFYFTQVLWPRIVNGPSYNHPQADPPVDEASLIEAVQRAAVDYKMADNAMLKGAARPKRAKALCAILNGERIQGWIGRVETLASNNSGKGVLAVRISDEIVLSTMNNSFSDTLFPTLISPETPLFERASRMSVGDAVVISGAFNPDADDCIQEISLTVESAMTVPEFLFRFDDVQPLGAR